MKINPFIPLAVLLIFAPVARAVTWIPEQPVNRDVIRILLPGFTEGDQLHWAITVGELSWTRPDDAYLSTNSTRFGTAVRNAFVASPEDPSTGIIELGPFNKTQQQVQSIVFAIARADGSWDNNNGEDYIIPVSAGRITVSPAAPTANDIVTVTVHESAPGAKLRLGVNADRVRWTAMHPVYQPEGTVTGDDGVGVDIPLPDPDESGRATIRLGPFNRGEQVVSSLHMALHWMGVWDNNLGRNYNVPVRWQIPAGSKHSLRIVEPSPDAVANNFIGIKIDTTITNPVTLWINGEPATTLTGPSYAQRFSLYDRMFGRYQLTARAEVEGHVLLDTVTFWREPARIERPLPEGTGYGVTEHGDGAVTFALYAPGKKQVELIGNFSGPGAALDRAIMFASPDGSWWLTKNLAPGTYWYQYVIDSAYKLGDPYARQVDWTNAEGQKGWMPEDARTVIEIGREPYAWSATDYQRPTLDELVIYELYIEDFAPGEGFDGITKRLDYIADLGVNAIEPMPWHPWTGRESWGYNPAFHFAVEQLYGTPDQLKRLIDACHQRGMAVIIDMVLNHAEWHSPLYQLYGGDYDASPYFRAFSGHNWGFPKIDQESPAVKRYVADVIRHWIEDYRIDGFRYDATRWTGWSGYHDWGASWFAYVARQADPHNIQIAEHLPIEPPLVTGTEIDTSWHAEYRWRIRELLTSASLLADGFAEAMDARRVGFSHPHERIPYTESHDEERVVRDLRLAGFAEDEVFRRAASALAITLTTPGVPMIYAGQEFGEGTDKKVGWNHLNWSLLNQEPNRRLHTQTKELIRLRRHHPALRGDGLDLLTTDESTGLAVYRRGEEENPVYVAVNFGREPVTAKIPFAAGSGWTDALTRIAHDPTAASFTLLPGEAKVWFQP